MHVQVNEAKHWLRSVAASAGERYIVEGITDVIDPRKPLVVACMGTRATVHPESLQLRPDPSGNMSIVVSLNGRASLCIHVLIIDDALVAVLQETPLHGLVQDRVGCLAVSGYELDLTETPRVVARDIDRRQHPAEQSLPKEEP